MQNIMINSEEDRRNKKGNYSCFFLLMRRTKTPFARDAIITPIHGSSVGSTEAQGDLWPQLCEQHACVFLPCDGISSRLEQNAWAHLTRRCHHSARGVIRQVVAHGDASESVHLVPHLLHHQGRSFIPWSQRRLRRDICVVFRLVWATPQGGRATGAGACPPFAQSSSRGVRRGALARPAGTVMDDAGIRVHLIAQVDAASPMP